MAGIEGRRCAYRYTMRVIEGNERWVGNPRSLILGLPLGGGKMVGIKGRLLKTGGRKPACTRWACQWPLKSSGLPRRVTSRDKEPI
jgi:hypothetical protein